MTMGSHQSARMQSDVWLTPPEIIRAALREFGRRLTYVSSFGAESAAMLS